MSTTTRDKKLHAKFRTARPAAPEDLRAGQYIAVTRVMLEDTPLFCDRALGRDMPVMRAWLMPGCAGDPMRIVSICLPFVLVETPERRCRTLDLRRWQIVRLPKGYGRTAFERLAKPTRNG